MIGNFSVTTKTRIPSPAAFEPQSDDIRGAIPMAAACFGINVDPENIYAVHGQCHRC
jgi:hypothetical protein